MSSQPAKAAKPLAEAGAEAGAEGSAPKKGGKKKLIILAAPLLLVLVGAGLWFGGILPPLLGMGHEEHAEEGYEGGKSAHGEAKAGEGKPGEHKPGERKTGDLKAEAAAKAKVPVFVDLPDLIANLNVGQRKSTFIKLKARIEIAKVEDTEAVKAALPRLQDLFTTYLREIRPEELRGSAGTYRLREELLARANIATTPARVVDVLFTEMIIQ